jgi:hypothetical protein
MTDYQHVWEYAQKGWNIIDLKAKQLASVMLVFAWIGMVGALVFGVLTLLSRTDLNSSLMLGFLLLWMGCGIAFIRIRRTQKKLLILPKWK